MIDFKRSKEIFLKIMPNEELAEKIESYIKSHKITVEFFLIFCRKSRWEVMLKLNPMMKLSLVYAFLPIVRDRYTAKHIGEEIFYDTISDIKIWIDDHYARTGEYGLYELHWIMHHMNLNIFKLGRLQFQKSFWHFKTPYEKNGVKINFGDKIIKIHIPRGDKLDVSACQKSLKTAKVFFEQYFSEYPSNRFVCDSWLLYPKNKDFMPAESNILKFADMFDIVEENETPQQTYLWIFGVKLKNPALMNNKREMGNYGYIDILPQKTSLQKSAVEYIKNGGTFGDALGVIIL